MQLVAHCLVVPRVRLCRPSIIIVVSPGVRAGRTIHSNDSLLVLRDYTQRFVDPRLEHPVGLAKVRAVQEVLRRDPARRRAGSVLRHSSTGTEVQEVDSLEDTSL